MRRDIVDNQILSKHSTDNTYAWHASLKVMLRRNRSPPGAILDKVKAYRLAPALILAILSLQPVLVFLNIWTILLAWIDLNPSTDL